MHTNFKYLTQISQNYTIDAFLMHHLMNHVRWTWTGDGHDWLVYIQIDPMTSLKASQSRKLSFLARQPYVTRHWSLFSFHSLVPASRRSHWWGTVDSFEVASFNSRHRGQICQQNYTRGKPTTSPNKYVNKKHYLEYLQKKKLSV
jgi:hypothetical protein